MIIFQYFSNFLKFASINKINIDFESCNEISISNLCIKKFIMNNILLIINSRFSSNKMTSWKFFKKFFISIKVCQSKTNNRSFFNSNFSLTKILIIFLIFRKIQFIIKYQTFYLVFWFRLNITFSLMFVKRCTRCEMRKM